jgi:hypothetical protein
MPTRIGTLAEKSLHASLKQLYAQPGDLLEHPLDGYVIDILRPLDAGGEPAFRCIEIQTGSLAKMKPKLMALLPRQAVHVVFPVAQERTIVRLDSRGSRVSSRRSPKRGTVLHVFPELVSLPALLQHPHFSLEVLLIREEQIWCDDGRGSWRRKRWSVHDRRLLGACSSVHLASSQDYAALLPPELTPDFDCRQLADALAQPLSLAQKMAYCLRHMEILRVSGKRGNRLCYVKNTVTTDPSAAPPPAA